MTDELAAAARKLYGGFMGSVLGDEFTECTQGAVVNAPQSDVQVSLQR